MYRSNQPHRKEKRQATAKVRQEAYSKLTTEEKLAKATPGSKVYTKLQTQATKQKTDV